MNINAAKNNNYRIKFGLLCTQLLTIFLSVNCYAKENGTCSQEIEYNKMTFDYIPHYVEEYALLLQCAASNNICVTAFDSEKEKTVLISGDEFSSNKFNKTKNLQALTAFATLHDKKYGKICVNVLFSGGSANAWSYDAISEDRKFRISQRNLSITGEIMTPSQLLVEVRRVASNAVWKKWLAPVNSN